MQTLFLKLFTLENFSIQGEWKDSQCPSMAKIMNIQQPIMYIKYKYVSVFWFAFVAKTLRVYN